MLRLLERRPTLLYFTLVKQPGLDLVCLLAEKLGTTERSIMATVPPKHTIHPLRHLSLRLGSHSQAAPVNCKPVRATAHSARRRPQLGPESHSKHP